MNGMTDLVEFLGARLDEDEALALKQPKTDVRRWAHYLMWARFSRARVLAEVAAKRAIVEFHRADGDQCGTLLALAQPYADHADFQDAWRVTFDALYPD